MIPIPYNTKLIDRNEKVYGSNDGSHCIICNKPVNVDTHKLWVRIIFGTEIGTAEEAEAEAESGGDLGYYPIGKDCLKRHPQLVEYVRDSVA